MDPSPRPYVPSFAIDTLTNGWPEAVDYDETIANNERDIAD